MRSESFEHYRMERYANIAVDVSNKLFFLAPAVTSYVCFSYFPRKLWIVQVQYLGHFLSTPYEESGCTEFGQIFLGHPVYL